MSIVVFLILAVLAGTAIVYPLLPGQSASRPAPVLTDGDIEQAVRALRRKRSKSGHTCPACGRAYQPGDRFCVGCGAGLPEVASVAMVCPSCGAALRDGDRFCPKCGHNMAAGEAA
jgi:predicted RNA-binding Zn-ribbon protein involved in translation (DUF1610 family)